MLVVLTIFELANSFLRFLSFRARAPFPRAIKEL